MAAAEKTYTSFPSLKKNIIQRYTYNTDNFTSTIYPNPHQYIKGPILDKIKKIEKRYGEINIHDEQHAAMKNQILKIPEIQHLLKIFGNNIQNGVHCLDITEDSFLNNIVRREYLAFIHVQNDAYDDYAVGGIQYLNWCTEVKDDPKQLWIHALCRINRSGIKLKSPISVLFDVVEQFSRTYNITDNYLLVVAEQPGTDKLLSIYSNYGFKIDKACRKVPIEYNDNIVKTYAIAMKKSLIRHNSRNNAAYNNNQLMNNSTAAAANNNQLMNNSRAAAAANNKNYTRKNRR